jgi:phosphate transport system permease protein
VGQYRPDLGTEIPVRRAGADFARSSLVGRRFEPKEYAFQALLFATLVVALAVLVALVANMVAVGWRVFADRGTDFFAKGNSTLPFLAGIRQGLVGSLTLMVFVIILAFPLGIGAAVYLEEYARDTRFTRFLSTNIRNLAGVPSIVYGLLGLAIFVEAMRGVTGGFSVISGGLTLAILVLPLVIITASEAIRAVPSSLREAAYGVGATKWEVVRTHVLPSAAPGIFTGTVLSVARAFGETAPLLLVGALTGFFTVGTGSMLEQLRGNYTTLPTVIFSWSSLPEAGFRRLAAAAIVVLLALLLVVNTTAIILRNRFERTW